MTLFALAQPVGAAVPTTRSLVDRRIDAIPSATLLKSDPSRLVEPSRQRAAQNLAAVRRPTFFVWAFVQIIALVLLWRSGNAAGLRDRLRRRFRSKAGVRFLFGASLALVTQLAALPVSFVSYRIAYAMSLSAQPVLSWLVDAALSFGIAAIIAGAVVACVLALVDRTRLWYLFTAGGLFVVTLGLVFVEPLVLAPLFNVFTPLDRGAPLAQRIETLTRVAGVGDAPIFVTNLSKQSLTANANVAGFGSTRRIVLGDTLLSSSTPNEIAFVVAHELGHFVRGDALRLSLFGTIVLIVAAAAAIVVSDRIGFRRDDDPLSRLALVGALLGCAMIVLYPAYTAYSRSVEARADRYALELTHDPAAGIRSFVRFTDDGLVPLCPPRLVRVYLYDHPPYGSRIAALTGRRDPCP